MPIDARATVPPRNLALAFAATLCLLGAQVSAGEDWDTPPLPLCKPAHEWRTPVPRWQPHLSDDGKLTAGPPDGKDQVIYVDTMLDAQAPACSEPPRGDFVFDVAKGAPGAINGLKVKIAVNNIEHDSARDCIFTGFFINTPNVPGHEGPPGTTLRQLDTLDVMLSGRYCRVDTAALAHRAARLRGARPASLRAHPLAILPTCRRAGEERMEIPVWDVQLAADDELRSEPPQGRGKLVFMSIVRNVDCPGVWQDQFYRLERLGPKEGDLDPGGFAVALRGNVRSENGHCVWSGLFMNDSVGSKMGWTTTAFIAVDEARIASSGQYCLTRLHGPLHRPTRPK